VRRWLGKWWSVVVLAVLVQVIEVAFIRALVRDNRELFGMLSRCN
jgi:hypothetical protein